MTQTFQPGPFDRVDTYDFPLTTLTQVWDGEWTARTGLNTLFNPSHLSPRERDSFATRLKSITGEHAVTNGIIDLAMNPLVWMGFLFSPGAETALSKGTRIFTQYAKDGKMLLPGMHTARDLFVGTEGEAIIDHINIRRQNDQAMHIAFVGEAENKFLKSLRDTGSNVKAGRGLNQPDKTGRLQRAYKLFEMAIEGSARDVVRPNYVEVPRFTHAETGGQITDNRLIKELFGQMKMDATNAQHRPLIVWEGEQLGEKFLTAAPEPQMVRDGKVKRAFEVKASDRAKGEWEFRYLDNHVERAHITDPLGEDPDYGQKLLDEHIAQFPGLAEVIQAHKDSMRWKLIQAVGNDEFVQGQLNNIVNGHSPWLPETREQALEVLDTQKIARNHIGTHHLDTPRGGQDNDWGIMNMIFSPATLESMQTRAGKVATETGEEVMDWAKHPAAFSRGQFEEAVKEGFWASINTEAYMPRNVTVPWTTEGEHFKRLTEDEYLAHINKDRIPPSSSRLHERVGGTHWDPDDLKDHVAFLKKEFGIENVSPHVENQIQDSREYIDRMVKLGQPARLYRRQAMEQINRYHTQMSRDNILYGDSVPEAALDMQRKNLGKVASWGHELVPPEFDDRFQGVGEDGRPIYRDKDINYLDHVMEPGATGPVGGWNIAWALKALGAKMRDPRKESLLLDTVLPAALGTLPHNPWGVEIFVKAAQALSAAGRKLPGASSILETDFGKKWVPIFDAFEQADSKKMAYKWSTGITDWLYSSHLGFNIPSVIQQMLQPELHLTNLVGSKAVAAGRIDALKELLAYGKERVKLPAIITPAQRKEILNKPGVLSFPDESGIVGHLVDDLEEMSLHYGDGGTESRLKFWTVNLPLKAFEKAEWWNRLTSIHAVKHAYRNAGMLDDAFKPLTEEVGRNMRADMVHMRAGTQFSTGPLDTPLFMMKGPLSSPIMKQFQTFTLRSPISFLTLGPRVNQGKRVMRGTGWEVPWWLGDTARILGHSALIYEVAKNVGVDVSSALAVNSATALVGGDRFIEGQGLPLSLPPAWDIPLNITRGAIGGDTELIKQNLARMVPSGIAVQRALGVMGKAEGVPNLALAGIPSALQKQWAGWSTPSADGMIPVFKGDGSLVDYQSPVQLLLKGLGVKTESHRHAADMDRFLANNREEILQYRQEMLASLLANNVPKAMKVRKDFEQKFGVPLTVSQQQLQSAIRQRNTPRSERMMDSMPSEVRMQYQQILAANPQRLASTKEALLNANTSGQRKKMVTPPDIVKIDPQTKAQLDQLLAEAKANRGIRERSFVTFKPQEQQR